MSPKHDPMDTVRELWEALLRFRWRFVITAFLAAAAVLCVSLVLPRKYKAEATFERRTDMVLTEIARKGAVHSFQDPRASLANELVGQPAIDELVARLEPELRRRGLLGRRFTAEDLRHDLLRRVLVRWDVSSNVFDRIRVTYVGADPQLASLAVNGLVQQYIDRSRAVMEQRLNQSAAFFRDEAARCRQGIDELENALIAFEIQNNELLPENPNNVQAQLALTQARLAEMLAAHEAAAARAAALRRALEQTPARRPTVITRPNPRVTELQQKRRDLQARLDLSTHQLKMTAQHPDVIALKQQITRAEEELAHTDTEVVTEQQLAENPRHTELELLLAAAVAEHRASGDQVAELRRQIAEMTGDTAGMFAIRSQHQKMNRQVQEAQRQLAFWEDNLRRVEMALTAEQGDRAIRLDFIMPATAAATPVSPDLAQVLAAALGLGLLAGGLGVFFAHRADESFHSGADLAAAADLPLLGSVGELISRRQRRLRQLRRFVLYPANALAMSAALGAVTAVLYLDLEHPDSLASLRSAAGRLVAPDEDSPAPSQAESRRSTTAPPTDLRSASASPTTD